MGESRPLHDLELLGRWNRLKDQARSARERNAVLRGAQETAEAVLEREVMRRITVEDCTAMPYPKWLPKLVEALIPNF